MTTSRRPLAIKVALRLAHYVGRPIEATLKSSRRRRFIWKLHWVAGRHNATVEVDLASDISIGRDVSLAFGEGTANRITIGPKCIIDDRVHIELRGGELTMGEGCDIRQHCDLGVGGKVTLEGMVLLQQGCTIHCDEAVTIKEMAGLGEYTTVVDSAHVYNGPSEWFLHDIVTAPTTIGRNAWIGAKTTIGKGVTIGTDAVVGADSMVVKDVPDGYLASGVPAQLLRPVAKG